MDTLIGPARRSWGESFGDGPDLRNVHRPPPHLPRQSDPDYSAQVSSRSARNTARETQGSASATGMIVAAAPDNNIRYLVASGRSTPGDERPLLCI